MYVIQRVSVSLIGFTGYRLNTETKLNRLHIEGMLDADISFRLM